MRLIIVENQLKILKVIREMLKEVEEKGDLVTIWCNMENEVKGIPHNEQGWFEVATEDELFKIIKDTIGIEEEDCFLLDITLSKESQRDSEFEEYLSVRLAKYIESLKEGKVKIKFYTYPRGISVRDFAEETRKWGMPVYRPELERDYVEEDAKEQFVDEIKEFCNV